MTASPHTRRTVTSSLGLATTVKSPPRPALPLLPPPLASGTVHLTTLAETPMRASQAPSALATDKPTAVRHLPPVRRQHCRRKHILFTRCPCYRLVQRPAPTSRDRCLACWVSAQHVVSCIRSTQRHSHTCFCEEPTGSFAACYEVSRCYAGDGSLRLERRSSQPRHGSLHVKLRAVGDGSPCFGRRSLSYGVIQATGACAPGAAPLSLGTGGRAPSAAPPSHAPRSSQTAAPARRSYQRGCPTPPPAMRWRSV